MSEQANFFVTPDWLQDNLDTPGVTIIDGSWYLPAQNRDPKAEYDAAHIPGAVFFDHEQVVEPSSTLPHTLPTPEDFARIIGAAGIAADDTIIVYDGPGLFTAPRVWWMLRTFGAKDVRILEGGFDSWKAAGRPVTDELTPVAPCVFHVDPHPDRIASFEDMMGIVESGERQIADARPAGRFTGKDPEPREGMRTGHMPGARSLPALSLARDGKLLPADELKARIESAGLDLQKPIVTSCGSGITAAVLFLALESLGHKDVKLYDGSWSEWGSRTDTPVTTGEA
ncbi:3-mercaptopyruvate sulfurtransferase [Tianweitania sp.]|uniref:3-mercaptopyruvate sulfurtransferase n=1 Tax=Tianweitania sp. TaxID=2021634 RepID=UPI002898369B|nr:3-mercaptopyruvate sulfurtransferase [Tianweitania sp.]